MTEWNKLSSIVQGDISYDILTGNIYDDYAEIQIKAYSEKWPEFDAEISYKLNEEYGWLDNINISNADIHHIERNRLYGLKASKYGTSNSLRWNFTKNFLRAGLNPKVKVKILPRTRHFSTSNQYHIATDLYGKQDIDVFDGTDTDKCIGLNNQGQAIILDGIEILIKNNISDTDYVYRYNWLLNAEHAIQTPSGTYIIADTGKNMVIELPENLGPKIRSWDIDSPVFVDFSPMQETLLVTTNGALDKIYEITWSELDYGTTLWESNYSFENPKSAKYKENNTTKFAISDTGNNRVILYDDGVSQYSPLYGYKTSSSVTSFQETTAFNEPFRSFWGEDGSVIVTERKGKTWDFDDGIESSSSSSSSN
tara:strand:- start:26400 stop:27500 length:1101 start_codon:yes stop_codon:yes gene_type:complete